MMWRNCAEELPLCSGQYLVTEFGRIYVATWNNMDYCWDDESGDDYWHEYNYFTHWIEMPGLPVKTQKTKVQNDKP
jgi:hypothetical protein